MTFAKIAHFHRSDKVFIGWRDQLQKLRWFLRLELRLVLQFCDEKTQSEGGTYVLDIYI